MILGRENNTNNNGRVEIEINENLINFEPEMANQTLKLPLKEVAKLVPEFDGNNIPLGVYIEKIKQAKGIISATDVQNLVQILKIKLKSEVYKALANLEMAKIETFIQALRKLYPSTDNIYSLYGKLTQQIQKSDENVLCFANNLRALGIQIVELKKLEPNVTGEILTRFKTELKTEILNSLKRGLKQEIRIELGENQTFDNAVQKAMEIESNLKKQNSLRNATTSILFNFETQIPNKIKSVFANYASAKKLHVSTVKV